MRPLTVPPSRQALMGNQWQRAAQPPGAEPDPLAALMDALAALPRLADQEDEIQVGGHTCQEPSSTETRLLKLTYDVAFV